MTRARSWSTCSAQTSQSKPVSDPTVRTEGTPIPTCITVCCREWVSPFGYPGGHCGYCDQRPTFVRMLPESEWVTLRPPFRPEVLDD